MPGVQRLSSFVALFAVLLLGTVYSDDDRPSITISQGTLRGQKVNSEYGTYYSFLGIPYAKPPVGDLRFKAPVPPDPWNGSFEASEEGSVCKQTYNLAHLDGNLINDENCLFINVYTPQLPDSENLLPVLVWIHGGGFTMGSGNYEQQGPEFLISHGIIYASINYRLGVFGFLATEDDASPGNAGLKDQSQALHWVQQNIASFGGDPTRVTIFGESAGAISVQYQMISPMSAGLFRGIIAESGSATMAFSYISNPKEQAIQLGNALGYSGNNTHELVDFLRTIDADKLLEISTSTTIGNPTGMMFSPSMEPVIEGETQFVSDSPTDLLSEGKFQDVPYLTGFNNDEGLLLLQAEGFIDGTASFEDIDQNFGKFFNPYLRYCRNEPCSDKLLAKIRSFYFGGSPVTNATLYNLVNLETDIYFTEPTLFGIDRMFPKMNSPVYLYEFSYDGDLAFSKEVYPLLKNYPGVVHGDELGYLFNIGKSVPAGSPADNSRSKMVTLWTNFVKTGNPTPVVTGNIPEWLPYNNSTSYFLDINSDITVKQYAEKRRVDFWRELYAPYE